MLKLAVVALFVALAFGRNTYWDDKTPEQIKGMFGTRLDGGHSSRDHFVVEGGDVKSMPTSFMAATKWPHCASTISYIKDQAACGSCWAVAASEVIEDRTCISCSSVNSVCANNARLNEAKPCIAISAEQIMSCCTYCGDGCQGGYPIDAMRYWATTGVSTGGAYGTKCGCQPYQVSPTDHTEHPTPACKKSCQSGYPVTFQNDLHFATDHKTLKGEAAIMADIYANGPVECAFEVYENFMDYPNSKGLKNGIYWRKEGEYMGGHAIKVVGWGETNGDKYWVINNSWNTTWGNSGTFKFRRGNDLCGMEAQCVSGTPKCANKADNLLKCLS